MDRVNFYGTIVIVDPCLITQTDDEWVEGGYFDPINRKISLPHFSEYIWVDTISGDGYWKVEHMDQIQSQIELENHIDKMFSLYDKCKQGYNAQNQIELELEIKKRTPDNNRVLVDSGTFGVFYLNDILKYNPDFLTDNSGSYVIIEDFVGTVEVIYKTPKNDIEQPVIIGVGNNSFYTESIYVTSWNS